MPSKPGTHPYLSQATMYTQVRLTSFQAYSPPVLSRFLAEGTSAARAAKSPCLVRFSGRETRPADVAARGKNQRIRNSGGLSIPVPPELRMQSR